MRAKAEMPSWRTDGDTGRAFALVLTKAGRQAAATPDASELSQAPVHSEPGSASDGVEPAEARTALPSVPPASPTVEMKAGSKIESVTALLRREHGASLDELVAATGWLPHTTRAALTGLRKRGFAVTRQAAEDQTGSVYRLGPSVAQPA